MKQTPKEVIKAYALDNAVKYKGEAKQGSVISGLFAAGLKKEEITEHLDIIAKEVEEVNKLSLGEQEKLFEKHKHLISKREIRVGLPELDNAKEGKLVMRFAPFPSGPLHIGNARQLILNDEYVKKYKGKLILVFDDTIGSEEKPILPEAYKLIEEGVKWLGAKYDKIIYKSDRIETYYGYAEEMIKKGYMYVCDCPYEEMKENKAKGIACSCRELGPEIHLTKWKSMFDKKQTQEGQMCVRLKTSMQDPNPAFRDRVMFRISDRTHPKLKDKYRVWPLLDFTWAIEDHLLGMTHIIRGVELQMETRTEKFIWDIFRWKHPEVVHTGHLILKGVKLSKSKGSKEVKSGEYTGWNDPRLWSLQSLKDRGIQPGAIREFIVKQGLTKSGTTVPVDVLYTINKQHLENVPSYHFVDNPTEIRICGCPKLEAQIVRFKDKKSQFTKYETCQEFLIPETQFESLVPGIYRLQKLLNFEVIHLDKTKPKKFHFISEEDSKEKKSQKTIVWLPTLKNNTDITIVMPDGIKLQGKGEPELKDITPGTTIRFEKFGFCTLHKKDKNNLEFWFGHN
jgi:glutamyl-tRNA synthetase